LGFFGGTTLGTHHGVSCSKESTTETADLRERMSRARKMVNERKEIGVVNERKQRHEQN
jgi:hypothetical protein